MVPQEAVRPDEVPFAAALLAVTADTPVAG